MISIETNHYDVGRHACLCLFVCDNMLVCVCWCDKLIKSLLRVCWSVTNKYSVYCVFVCV